MSRENILILDPEQDICELCSRALETQRDCKCHLALKEEEALSLLQGIPFDLLLIDMDTAMPDDFLFLKRIRRLFPRLAIVIAAYLYQKESIPGALSAGAVGHLIKPIKVDAFRKKMAEFLSRSKGE